MIFVLASLLIVRSAYEQVELTDRSVHSPLWGVLGDEVRVLFLKPRLWRKGLNGNNS